MHRRIFFAILLALLLSVASHAQANPNLQTYFKEYIGLSDDQIAAIRGGQAFAKNLHSRNADEIFVFGAVYVKAAPESYVSSPATSTAFVPFLAIWPSASSVTRLSSLI